MLPTSLQSSGNTRKIVSGNLEKSQEFPRFLVEEGQTMNARELKHEALVMEWQGKIAACRGSGMAVSRWCKEQGITAKTYYRWEREVLARASQQLAVRGERESPAFVEVRTTEEAVLAAKFGEGIAVARLRTAAGELEVYRGADRETLGAIIGALKDAE